VRKKELARRRRAWRPRRSSGRGNATWTTQGRASTGSGGRQQGRGATRGIAGRQEVALESLRRRAAMKHGSGRRRATWRGWERPCLPPSLSPPPRGSAGLVRAQSGAVWRACGGAGVGSAHGTGGVQERSAGGRRARQALERRSGRVSVNSAGGAGASSAGGVGACRRAPRGVVWHGQCRQDVMRAKDARGSGLRRSGAGGCCSGMGTRSSGRH
jgi:hypothetical protein